MGSNNSFRWHQTNWYAVREIWNETLSRSFPGERSGVRTKWRKWSSRPFYYFVFSILRSFLLARHEKLLPLCRELFLPLTPFFPIFLSPFFIFFSFLFYIYLNVSITSLAKTCSTRTCQLTGSHMRVRTNSSTPLEIYSWHLRWKKAYQRVWRVHRYDIGQH